MPEKSTLLSQGSDGEGRESHIIIKHAEEEQSLYSIYGPNEDKNFFFSGSKSAQGILTSHYNDGDRNTVHTPDEDRRGMEL